MVGGPRGEKVQYEGGDVHGWVIIKPSRVSFAGHKSEERVSDTPPAGPLPPSLGQSLHSRHPLRPEAPHTHRQLSGDENNLSQDIINFPRGDRSGNHVCHLHGEDQCHLGLPTAVPGSGEPSPTPSCHGSWSPWRGLLCTLAAPLSHVTLKYCVTNNNDEQRTAGGVTEPGDREGGCRGGR